MVMHRLNGKIIPNSRPPARYKLNHNSNRILPGEKNFSIWVGDLTLEVDDLELYKFFSARFQTIISAKVVLDESGGSKGFGFIRFGNETEQQTALTTMQGIAGLGGKPIKVSIAVQKAKDHTSHSMEIPMGLTQTIQKQLTGQYNGGVTTTSTPPAGPGGEYGAYYNQYNSYWSNMAAWQQYQGYYQGYQAQEGEIVNPPLPPNPYGGEAEAGQEEALQQNNGEEHLIQEEPESIFDGPLNQPVDHAKQLNYHALNSLYTRRTEKVWLEMEGTGWWDRD
ncbi:tRNA selenocysteine 1-associated protein 1-like [Eurytemora carolleeae]|uniref:tRNA selenocysteine 1-associated protein 1-like n=1 Tax=Eurytemora carolleeae TaxID=1294199 RepID=UPI000C7808F1|nr:tRNA selenocysteine 1-associated protein 1-like [Eurytemora carolleeae]|eukprot:XP_023321170.1 tRNA selenocysteine 1-associated protein 1-like [Eurytemora affinis]